MNKNLLTLAVAAVLAAPAIASAEAIMYGKLNVSIDYENIDNQLRPLYNNSATAAIFNAQGQQIVAANAGADYYVMPSGAVALVVPTGTVLNAAQLAAVRGTTRIAPYQTFEGSDFSGWGMSDNNAFQGSGRASRLGVKGSEDLGNGLKAIYQIELQISTNDLDNNIINNVDGGITYRNTFVGLAGDWGTFLMGRHDTPLKISTGKLDLFSDTMADYNGTVGFQDLRADNAIAYVSPSLSGFQLAAAVVPAGGSTGGLGNNINSDSITGGWSVAAIYSNGPFYGSLAYEVLGGDFFMNQATSLNSCFSNDLAGNVGVTYQCNQVNSDFTKWRLGLGLLNWNGFTLTGIYEYQDNLPGGQVQNVFLDNTGLGGSFSLPGGADTQELWQLQAGYTFGNFMVKAMYGQASLDGDFSAPTYTAVGVTPTNAALYNQFADDLYGGTSTSWALGVDYNFSKRTTMYVLYTQTTADGADNPGLLAGVPVGVVQAQRNDWDGFSLGLMHSF